MIHQLISDDRVFYYNMEWLDACPRGTVLAQTPQEFVPVVIPNQHNMKESWHVPLLKWSNLPRYYVDDKDIWLELPKVHWYSYLKIMRSCFKHRKNRSKLELMYANCQHHERIYQFYPSRLKFVHWMMNQINARLQRLGSEVQ